MAAIAALEGRVVASINPRSSFRSRTRVRGFVMMPTSKSFRTFRTIRKSPRLTRSTSTRLTRSTSTRVVKRLTTSAAMLGDNYLISKEDDDVMKRDVDDGVAVDDEGVAGSVVETVNAVLEDIVDGQRYIKETGRTKARPMKRRALVVSLALGAFRGPLDDVENRLGSLRRTTSTSRLTRTPSSSGFARTAQLLTQLSVGASPR